HAAFLARELNIPQVFIPGKPGILSAFGMLMADVIKDYSQTVMLPENETSLNVLESHFRPIEERGRDDLIAEGLPDSKVHLRRYLDIRYQGQSYELLVPYGEDYRDRFHRVHEKTYGYCNQDKEIEVVNVRVRAIGTPEKPNVARLPSAGEKIAADAVIDVRPVVFDGSSKQTKIIDRKILQHGNRVSGPAIIVEYSSTIVVPPFAEVRIDAYGNIIMDIEGQEGTS
nr:hydantoinase/oxoprolinase family protein [Gammaproteobacteria bacterium]